MGTINLEDIKAGMILGGDIKDRNGLVLLSAGHEITEKHLKILKMWGIMEVDIEGVTREETISEATSQIDPLLLQEAETKIREQFRHTDMENRFMNELFRLLTLRSVHETLRGENHGS